jgi:Protein of unknown function (DUF4236)
MGFRFRRSVKIFPGVRFNLSPRGVSTTIGGPALSLNVGSKGAFVNAGIPGSGLSYREKISSREGGQLGGSPAATPRAPTAGVPLPTPFLPEPPRPGEIRSGENEAITSVGLRELRALLGEVHKEAARLKAEVPAAQVELARAQSRAFKWENGFLLKHLLRSRFAAIQAEHETARSESAALQHEIEKCRVALEIEMEGGIDTSYGALVDAFRVLAACDRCWDTMSSVGVDKAKERSSATNAVTRQRVVPDLRPAEIIAPSRPAMHLPNANGGDIFILPGLLLVLGSREDFALIQLTEVRSEFSVTRFLETETVPSDTKVVGETWTKVNKDGSPDRRFANNHRIPIVEYGNINLTSAAGLNERFVFSSVERAERFRGALAAHQANLPAG